MMCEHQAQKLSAGSLRTPQDDDEVVFKQEIPQDDRLQISSHLKGRIKQRHLFCPDSLTSSHTHHVCE